MGLRTKRAETFMARPAQGPPRLGSPLQSAVEPKPLSRAELGSGRPLRRDHRPSAHSIQLLYRREVLRSKQVATEHYYLRQSRGQLAHLLSGGSRLRAG